MLNVKYSKSADWMMLIGAIAVTVLFIIFAAPVYNMFYIGSDAFDEEMYNSNMYLSISVITCCVVWGVAILYYWVIDSVSLSNFGMWSLFCLITIALSCGLCFYFPWSSFDEANLDFSSDLSIVALIEIPIALVLFVVTCIAAKRLSRNCSTKPF